MVIPSPCRMGGAEWQRRLRFRDALDADQRLAERYGRANGEWATLHRADREAYTQANTNLLQNPCRVLRLVCPKRDHPISADIEVKCQ